MTVATALDWRPLTPRFGADLGERQLSALDDGEVEALLDLLAERGVVVAHRQQMSVDGQIAFGARLGPLHVHPAHADGERPEILVIHSDETTTYAAGEAWHSDVSCEAEPPGISMLRMEVVPESGGDTVFADMYQAFATLSPALQQLLLGCTARHDSPAHFAMGANIREIPSNVHPVVRTHPRSGRNALYVNTGFTRKIVELKTRESDAVLKLLFDHVAYEVESQLRVHWEPDMVVLWDNRCVQHHASFDYHPAVRHGYRVTTVGECPSLDPATTAP